MIQGWFEVEKSGRVGVVLISLSSMSVAAQTSAFTYQGRLNELSRQWFGAALSADGTKAVAVVYGGQIYTFDPNMPGGFPAYLQGGQLHLR